MTLRDDAPSLRSRLTMSDDRLFALVVKMPAPASVEMAAYAGFDAVIIDTEHGISAGNELDHHLRAAEAANIPALVRVATHCHSAIGRALDSGAEGIITPHVTTGAQVASIVASARYPPQGHRGLATSTRAGKHGFTRVQDHVLRAETHTVIGVQIEDGDALPHLNDISATSRLDVMMIGPADLAASLGRLGQPSHPEVIAAIEQVAEAAAGPKRARFGTFASDITDAQRWVQRGARLVALPMTGLLQGILSETVERLRGTGSNHAPNTWAPDR